VTYPSSQFKKVAQCEREPIPGWSLVSSYTVAIYGMAKNLALDLNPIRVNAVTRGLLETEMWGDLSAEVDQAQMERTGTKFRTGRVGRPEDVANTYIWLIKDCNITGTVSLTMEGTELCRTCG
jgi:NAD(P)-dependent dehydrogenase (short-subunit alcohol dehydrogenase family)